MSEDWVKIDKKTPDKPEVAIIAAALQLDVDSVLGKLIRIWSWFDSNTVDGVTNVTVRPLLDRIAGVNGFTAVMEVAGWICETEDGRLMIPNFDRYMGKSAKTRALTASRVAKSRAKKAEEAKSNAGGVTDVTHAPLRKALPDREGELEGTHTHTAGAGGDEEGETGRGGGGERIPQAGFPPRQAVLDYATTKGWDLREASAFWLHHDDLRSQGEPYHPQWHWWSKLEKWIIDNQRFAMERRGGKGLAKRTNGNGGPSTPSDWGASTKPTPPTAPA